MLARLLCALALLWAVVLPALHGHPPAANAHAAESMRELASVSTLTVSGDAEAVFVAATDHSGPADLPLAWLKNAAIVMLAAVLLGALMPRRPASISRTGHATPRSRGSPIVRHEVARV